MPPPTLTKPIKRKIEEGEKKSQENWPYVGEIHMSRLPQIIAEGEDERESL